MGAEQSRFLAKIELLPVLHFSLELQDVASFLTSELTCPIFLSVLTLRFSSSIGFRVKALKSRLLKAAAGALLNTCVYGLCDFFISVSGLAMPFRTQGASFAFGDTKSFKFFCDLSSSPINNVGLNDSRFSFFLSSYS